MGQQYALRDATRDGSLAPEAVIRHWNRCDTNGGRRETRGD